MWYQSLLGGVIIAIATTLNLSTLGQVTGMSGLLKGIVSLSMKDWSLRWSTISGMVCASVLSFQLSPSLFDSAEEYTMDSHSSSWALGGVLVGVGTGLANGCTSGHGVCGLPRLSVRSLAAVMTFMLFGVITATERAAHPFLHRQDISPVSPLSIQWHTMGLVLLVHLVVMAKSGE